MKSNDPVEWKNLTTAPEAIREEPRLILEIA